MPKRKVGSRQPDVAVEARIDVPDTTGRSGLTLVLGDDHDMMYTTGAPVATDKETSMVDPRNDERQEGGTVTDGNQQTGGGANDTVEREPQGR